jgi:hypothetical protein
MFQLMQMNAFPALRTGALFLVKKEKDEPSLEEAVQSLDAVDSFLSCIKPYGNKYLVATSPNDAERLEAANGLQALNSLVNSGKLDIDLTSNMFLTLNQLIKQVKALPKLEKALEEEGNRQVFISNDQKSNYKQGIVHAFIPNAYGKGQNLFVGEKTLLA